MGFYPVIAKRITVSPYLPLVRAEAPPADEIDRIVSPNLVTADIRRPPIQRPYSAPSTTPWILSGEVSPTLHATVRQIDDVGRNELPLSDIRE